ncbi:MAG TPA: hypothetical protein VGE27_04660 [Gemmatimonas sp.]|uniref:hypothetical protein n=1 Tax=Gemmatimonas sp. TaxID=1962908 RepID=UPI002EDAB08A
MPVLGPAPVTRALLLVLIAQPLVAQTVDARACQDARAAERTLHADNLAALNKRVADVNARYSKDQRACTAGRPSSQQIQSCRRDALDKRAASMRPINDDRTDEDARHAKANLDIGRGACTARTVPRPPETTDRGTPTPPAEAESPILATDESARVFKLGAEMNVIADELQTTTSGNPGAEFLGGLADWAGETLQFLSQRPGVPLQQMAQSLVDYLTNDNTDNHRQLRASAEQALREFQANPARFIGKNLPNALPTGGLNRAGALRQINAVEKAAERVRRVATARRQAKGSMERTMRQNRAYGAGTPPQPCFASNACFPGAMAEADLFKASGGVGDGIGVRGVYPDVRPGGFGDDMAHTPEKIFERLEPRGTGYAPRRAGTFNPEQLEMIWRGQPVPMGSMADINRLLEREGIGSQGLVFVEYRPETVPGMTDVRGHVFNAQNHNGTIRHVDHTEPGRRAVLKESQINRVFFFPM